MIVKTYGAMKVNPRNGKVSHCLVVEAESGQKSARWSDGTLFSWKRDGKAMPAGSKIERDFVATFQQFNNLKTLIPRR